MIVGVATAGRRSVAWYAMDGSAKYRSIQRSSATGQRDTSATAPNQLPYHAEPRPHRLATTMTLRIFAFVLASSFITTCAAQSAPPPDPVIKDKVALCATCHGEGGNSKVPTYPILAGQNSRYLYLQLQDFKAARRQNDEMSPVAATLSREDMLALADYFSKVKEAPNGFVADGAKVALGRKKSDEVLCPMCHQGGFIGQNEIPRVAGQQYGYIKKQLGDFKARRRTNDAGNMTSVASTLSDDDIENLSQYIANLY